MRITNKIMQNNSLTNINNTKVAQDTLSSQISSGKKIVRPSDDPIVAIRALRLRSSVTEISQYYKSNVPDAEAWLNTTEDAMQQVTEVITDMLKQYTKGSNEYLKSSDRQIILEQLKSLRDEVYATGDADYAGRYVFTGYRTETSLKFTEDVNMAYQITEQLSASDLKMGTHVSTSFKMIERDADGNLLPDEIRLGKFGKALRATSLDELPEAFNILKGDSGIIGTTKKNIDFSSVVAA